MLYRKSITIALSAICVFGVANTHAAVFQSQAVGIQAGDGVIAATEAGQNLIYGVLGDSSTGSLMLLQNGIGNDKFRVNYAGDVTITGSITSGGQSVCLQNGTGCPAAASTGWTDDGAIVRLSTIGDSVGVGTISPDTKLHVVGNMTIEDTSGEIRFETGAAHYNWRVAAQEITNAAFEIHSGNQDADASNDTWTQRLRVDSSGNVNVPTGELSAKWLHATEAGDNTFAGNVGIGTTEPAYRLDVQGTAAGWTNGMYGGAGTDAAIGAVYYGGFGAQKLNARATAWAGMMSKYPNQLISVITVPWDGSNTLEYNCNNKINASWHAHGAVKGNYPGQEFDGSDFGQYSSFVSNQTEFDAYKSNGTQWHILCSTHPTLDNFAVSIAGNQLLSGDLYAVNNKSVIINSSAGNTNLIFGNYLKDDGSWDSGFIYGGENDLNIAIEGDVKGNRLCIEEDCKASWAEIVEGGGGAYWDLSGSDLYTNTSYKVGIGTASPTGAMLDVRSTQGQVLRLTDIRADSSYRGQLGIYANEANRAAETGLYIGMNPASVTGPTSFYQNNAAYIVNKLNAPLYLATNNTIRVTIDGSGHVSIPSGELRAKWLHSTEAGDNTFAGNVGIGTTAPVAKLTVAGDSNITGYEVITGNYTNNPYNSTTGARLMFGGGDANAQTDYYIGTNLEDYGGNYNKLDLRWHTGIRMGAQPGYGGIRFYDTEDLGTKIFSIGETDGNVRVVNNLYVGSAGGWMTDLLNAKMTSTGITEDTYVNLRVIRNNSVNGPDGMYIGYGQPEAIRFYSNTTEVARFNQGNQTFDVYGGAYVSGNVVMAGTELNNLNASNFYINANGSAQIRIDADQATAAGDNIFKINNGANATVLTVDESGNGTFSGTLTVGGKISGVSAPTTDTDAANKAYVDAAVAGLNRKFQVFLSSGTWTRPAGVDTVWVTMCGGGGGGNSGNFYSGGGGGGAGQVYIAYPVAVSGNVSVTIGSGGTAGGGDGQSTSFGSLLIADGGGGGGIGDYQFVDSAYLGIGGYGGRGGGGKGGNIYNTGTGGSGVNGGAGGSISGAGGAGGGGGAGTIFGFGGRGGTLVGGTSPEANTCAGGGGGGGNNNGGNASAAGGSGRVIVEWYE